MYKIHRIFPYDWKIDSKEVNVTSLRIYGLDEQNKTICVRVDNFTPYVYLELPDGIKWDEDSALKLCSKIDSLLHDKKPLFKSFEMKKRLYYAHIDSKGKRKKFPYLFLAFSTRSDIKTLSYKIRSPINIPGLGRIRLKMHEQDANEILQLTCRRNIPTAGWIKFKGAEIRDEDEKLTTCDKEFIVDWKNLSAEETDRVPPKPLILSFDLEVYSSDPNTMPKSERLGDKIFQISCVFCRQGDKDDKDFDKVLLTLGNPLKSIVGNDVDIRTFITEDDLIMGFTELIQEKQPNLVVGYNIFGFDIPYMIARATSPCMCFREFSRMGFIKNREAEMKIIKWSSSAYGNQEFEFLDAEGRLFVDLLPLVKRDYKMDTYSLKSISTFFIGETKDPLSAKGIFKCYDLGTTKKDDGSYGKKAKKAMAICGKYCVQDSALVLKLFDKLQTWIGLTEMARVCHVPIFTLYTQGQQIKVYSQVYKRCMYQGYVVEKDGYIVKENEHYTGAHVFEPIAGSYEDVIPFDFTSLYPTTIIAYNICWSTLVTDESYPDNLCHVFEWSDHVACILEGSNITIDEYSMKIEDLKEYNQNLLAFDKDNKGASYYKQTNFFNQGVKDCVKITFEDGTTLCCTPDHRILLSDYSWVEAQDIKINDDRVCTTYSPPVFDVDGIKLNIFDYTFSGSKLIKFYKILGILCSDGYCTEKRTVVYVVHKIDLKNIVRDIEELEKNSTSVYKINYGWGVTITGKLGKLFRNLDGMMWNAKINQVRTLPKILEKASSGELSAFLSGLFGGDGHTLSYSQKAQCLGTISLSWTSKKEEQLTVVFRQIEKYLKVCDISSCIYRINDSTYISIKTQDIFKFKEKINFSYCVHKSMRLEAGYSYLKLRDEVWSQQKWLVEKVKLYKNMMSINDATEKAIKDLKDNFPIYNEYYSSPTKSQMVELLRPRKKWEKPMFSYKHFPTAPKYLDSINAKTFFEGYGVDKDQEVIPFLHKKVINISPIGKKQVYDLQVNQSHSFVANGVLVHNCEHDTTVRKTRPKHKMCAERRYRFLKSPKGILPEMLTDLLDARKKTKIEMKDKKKLLKTISDSEKTNIETAITVLDKRQLAFKVSANSAYGAMGVQRGYLPFMPGAMCTTARGRQSIEKVAEYIPKEHGGQLIYGDTDSNYIHFPHMIGKSAQELWEYSEMVAADTSKLFPPPMRLEFEEVIYRKFFIITKKRYMCLSCDKEGNVSDKISKKGVILARRDNAKIVRDIYGDNMMKVFHKVPEDEILYDLINTFNKMFYKGFPYTDFIITKSVRGYNELKLEDVKVEECLNMKGEHKKDKNGELMYRKTGMIGDYKIELWKNKEEKERKFKVKNVNNEKDYYLRCLPAQVQLAEKMRCRGKPVSDGTRLEYVMLTDGTSKSVKDKKYEKIESAEYYNEYSHILKIDFLCYLDNISSSLDQVLNVVHKNKDFVLNQYKIRLQKLKVLEELRSIFEVKVFFDDPSQAELARGDPSQAEVKKDKGQKDIRSYFQKK